MLPYIQDLEIASADHRRTLAEFGLGGLWKVCKYLVITEDSVVGNHFHLLKDECFLLSHGSAIITINNGTVEVQAPKVINVPRGTYHSFNIKAGSILIGLASELHDPTDDHPQKKQ